MSRIRALEESAVAALAQANLPELKGFDLVSLAGQVDLENDQINQAKKSLLVAVVGATHNVSGGDSIDFAFVALVPGLDQKARRLEAMEALMAIRDWMDEPYNNFVPKQTRTERLHPAAIVALFAQLIG